MAPVDWNRVMEVDVANIEEDEADDLSNMLANVSTVLKVTEL